MINARSETVTEKASFRNAFKRRRCIVPASGFYEWQKQNGEKQPMYIQPTDEPLFAFAGLWETWHSPDGGELESCTILTTTPNELMGQIHNRMPVLLEPEDYEDWLEPGDEPEQGLHLLRPFPPHKMAAYPVSTIVNNPRNDVPDCIESLA
jgi:putative SOS response-associated peptidase YedK